MRSPDFEAGFIDEAARLAGYGHDGYQGQVAARLAEGARLYHDRAIRTPLRELVREIAEEGRDLGTWATLAAQCDELAAMEPDRRDAVVRRLLSVAALGALVEREVALLREEIG